MKWANHRIIGFSLPFAITGNILFSLGAAAFSAIPDILEGRRTILTHRGISHNPFFWLGLCLTIGICFVLTVDVFPIRPGLFNLFTRTGLSLFSGILLHLLADAMTMTGIPLSPIKKRFALKLFKTGAPLEYVISLFALFAACLINYKFILSSYFYLAEIIASKKYNAGW